MNETISILFSSGMIYLYIYLYLLFFVFIELIFKNRTISTNILRLNSIILILFLGLRWQSGTDWFAYFNLYYTDIYSSDYDTTRFGMESGFLYFNKFFKYFSESYTFFLLVQSTIAISLIYYFIEKSTKLPNMALYLFYTSYMITHFMGSNRRMIAIGIVCLTYTLLIKSGGFQRAWPAKVGSFFVALNFHRTAMMALPSHFISTRAFSTVTVIVALAVCVILGLSGAPFYLLQALASGLIQFADVTFVQKLIFYTAEQSVGVNENFDVMNQALLGLAKRITTISIFIFYMATNKKSEYIQRLYNIYITGCLIYFLMIGSPVFQIVSVYYTIVEIALIPIIFYNVKNMRIIMTIYIVIVPFLLLVNALSPYIDLYVPYRTIFR